MSDTDGAGQRQAEARHRIAPLMGALGRRMRSQPLNGASASEPPRPATAPPAGPGGILAPFSPGVAPRRDAIFRRLLAIADLVAAAGGLAAVGALSGTLAVASVATLPLIVVIAKVTGRYDHDEVVLRKSTLDEAPRLLTLAGAYALVWSLVGALAGVHSDRASVVLLWATTAAGLIGARAGARALGRRSAPAERVLIIGTSGSREMLARRLAKDPAARTEVVGSLPLEDERPWPGESQGQSPRQRRVALEHLQPIVSELEVDRVFVIPSANDSEAALDAVSRATAAGVKVSIVPRIFEVIGSAVEFDAVGGVTVLGLRRPGLSRSSRLIKRTLDVAASAVGLIVLSPFAALVALAIKLESPGPTFFRQPRVGRDGTTFQMIKFRSMQDGAEEQRPALESLNETDGVFKLRTDPRVTRVGRLLRSSSLDELPQLINVLRGEMSLVGPRPLISEEDRRVQGRHRGRLALSPGMTGPWQVLGPERPPLSEMVKLDYLYGANWSLWADVKILLRTIIHVTGRRGL